MVGQRAETSVEMTDRKWARTQVDYWADLMVSNLDASRDSLMVDVRAHCLVVQKDGH